MMKNICFIDFETTSLDPEEGEVIEGAVVLVELNEEGRIGRIVDQYESFNDPNQPIPPYVTKLTGITDEMVQGQTLDWYRLLNVCRKADVIIAHNARFDRAWLEKKGEPLSNMWGCSFSMVEWKESHGMPCGHLKHLAWEHKYFPNAHRAMDDVNTLVKLLDYPSNAKPERTYLQEILANVAVKTHVIFANGAPFDAKEKLRAKRFRWSTSKRVWWKVVKETELTEVIQFMSSDVYSANPGFEISEPIDPLDLRLEEKFGLK